MFREMRRKKQLLSREECVQILRTERRGVLAVNGDDGYPYAIPLNFYYDETEDKIFFHCAREGHKIDAIRQCNRVCFTVWNRGEQKEGDWSYYVRSVVSFGTARPVEDEAQRYGKLRTFGMKYYPTEEELDKELERDFNRVQLMEITVEHMTGKQVHEK